ncbi:MULTISPECIES: restriction endonuclease subunit S [Vibrio]|uniref:restriction endonuclease subunit S n=1 Tax=Vibrio TaxID=662 RepID=UPI002964FD5F|nr:restriction endonuclease subunit S [Vibrio sp. 1942]MDW2158287.1 restriction endonuclease subunit S [Vibrio sp. 1942]
MVPNCQNWEQKLFKSVLKLDRGSSPRPIVDFMTDADDGVNWIKIGDTKKGELYINSTKEKITPEGAKKSRKVSKGEIIVSNSMSYGQPYILNIDGYIHDGWFVIRNYEKHFEKNYLLQFLGSELIQRQYKRLAAGGVVSNISSDLVYAVKATIPPLPEQRKIAQILSTWDRGIATTEKLIDASKQQKKALMQQLLTGKKRLIDPETGKTFEGEWSEFKLSDIANYTKGYTYKSHEYSEEPTEYGFLTLKSILRGGGYSKKGIKYLNDKVDNKFSVKEGDVVFAVTDLTRNAEVVGAPIIVPNLPYENIFISMDLMQLEVSSSFNKIFLFYLLKLRENRNFMRARASGSTVLHLDIKGSKKMPLKLPSSIEEQQKIASVLTTADKEIELLEAKLAHFKQEKKALMQQLLTGKRRVKVAETEVA